MRLILSAAALCLLLSSATLGTTQAQTQVNSTLTAHGAIQAKVARAAGNASPLPESATSGRNKNTNEDSSMIVKRKALTAKQQQAGEDYERKLHLDDDYAKWAEDDNLKRGPAHSKLLRSTLYDHPGKVVLDRGVGLGKAWSADENGFISDRSDILRNLTQLEKQHLGLLPKTNRRLPPRPGHDEDPTVTADPPPEMTGNPNAFQDLLKKMKEFIPQSNATTTATAGSSTVTVDGVTIAVIPGSKSATDRSLITINGITVAIVTSAESSTSTTTATATASSTKATSGKLARAEPPSSSATESSLFTRLHQRDMTSALSKRAIDPQLAPMLDKFENQNVGRALLQVLSDAIKTEITAEQAVPIAENIYQGVADMGMAEAMDSTEVFLDAAPRLTAEAAAQGKTYASLLEEMASESASNVAPNVGGEAAAIAPLFPVEGSEVVVGAMTEAGLEAAGEGVGAVIGGEAIGQGVAVGASEAAGEGLGLVVGEVAGEAALEGAVVATEGTVLAGELAALAPMQLVPVVGQIAAGVIIFATILATFLIHLLHGNKHPKNPGGKLDWAWDWDNIPYQYDNWHPKKDQGERPEPTPPLTGCDTFDMDDLERRSWTTTQYAKYPCPTWIPQECSREWFEEFRSQHMDHENTRKNPVYCFETVPFKTTHHNEVYEKALKVSRVAEWSQYAGHELADADECLGYDKKHKDDMKLVKNDRCLSKFMPRMKHHNIENKECKSEEECKATEDKWIYKTTGWPKGCKKSELGCW